MNIISTSLFSYLIRIFLLLTVIFINSCASFFFDNQKSFTVLDLKEQGHKEVGGETGFFYGHGVGKTRDEALHNARKNIASTLLSNVRSEALRFHQELREHSDKGFQWFSETEMRTVIQSYTNIELEGVAIDAIYHAEDGVYIRVRMARNKGQMLIDRARRHLPALTYAEFVAAVPSCEPGHRLRLALRGLALTAELGINHVGFFHPGAGYTTFDGYFHREIESAISELWAVPLVEDRRVRFVVLDRQSLKPQPRFALKLNGVMTTTDKDGYTPWISKRALADRFKVFGLGLPMEQPGNQAEWRHPSLNTLFLDEIEKSEWKHTERTTLLVYTEPSGALLNLGGHERAAPYRFNVPPGRTYFLDINGQEYFEGASAKIEIPETALYAYHGFFLSKRRFGDVELEASHPDVHITAERKGSGLNALHSDTGKLSGRLEAGSYRIKVKRKSDDYQVVKDDLRLLPDQKISRRYMEPVYREPYHTGFIAAIRFLRAGGEPKGRLKLPWIRGNDIEYKILGQLKDVTGVDYEIGQIDVMLSFQYFFDVLPVTGRADLGLRNHKFTLHREDGSDVEMDLKGWHGSLGGGLWQGLLDGRLLVWTTLNYGAELIEWDSDTDFTVDGKSISSGSNIETYPFAEAGANLKLSRDDPLSLNISAAAPFDSFKPHISVGLSWQFMAKGYRLPAATSAQEGLHYE